MCAIGEHMKPTRDLRPHRALHGDFMATQEIRQSTFRRWSVLSDKPKQRGREVRLPEVGATYSS